MTTIKKILQEVVFYRIPDLTIEMLFHLDFRKKIDIIDGMYNSDIRLLNLDVLDPQKIKLFYWLNKTFFFLHINMKLTMLSLSNELSAENKVVLVFAARSKITFILGKLRESEAKNKRFHF